MSTIKVDTIKNSAGTREYFPCSAWVNFNGIGTIAIRDSGNVSSITDNGTGDYTVNFATSLANGDYSLVGTTQLFSSTNSTVGLFLHGTSTTATLKNATQCRVTTKTMNTSSTGVDMSEVSTTIHGGIS